MAIKQHLTKGFFLDYGNINQSFADRILTWYAANKRDLPWRNTKDAYSIWLSEVILQQTRVSQGRPYYERFIEAFPTVQDMAEASEEEVLRLWQGLGYYSRARNMHATAKKVALENNGHFPTTYKELLGLKGVGEYTAAAIASFAFQEQVAVVDGNVFRVLARYLGIENDISDPKSKVVFKEAAEMLMPKGKASDFNQAIMEMGALQCVPISPNCSECVLQDSCFANTYHKQTELPVKLKKTKVVDRFIHYIVFRKGQKLAMKNRQGKDIWTGLFDFYELPSEQKLSVSQVKTYFPSAQNVFLAHSGKHILSHQRLYIDFFVVDVTELPVTLNGIVEFYTLDAIDNLPKPIVIHNFLEKLASLRHNLFPQ